MGVPTWMLHPTPQLAHCCSLPHCPARPLQVAAAALLERLLETVVDEEALLEPTAGKPDKKDKKWQLWAAACAALRRAAPAGLAMACLLSCGACVLGCAAPTLCCVLGCVPHAGLCDLLLPRLIP